MQAHEGGASPTSRLLPKDGAVFILFLLMPTKPASRARPVEVAMPGHGVFVLESHHAADFEMEASAHDFLEVFLVIGGRGTFWIEGDPCASEAGDVMIVPPGCRHRIEDVDGQPLSLYGVCISPALCELEKSSFAAGNVWVPEEIRPRLRSELRRMLFEQTTSRSGSRWLLVGRALQFLGLVVRCQMAAESKATLRDAGSSVLTMRAYVEALEQRFYEPMDLDEESKNLGMSRRRFTQLFRQETQTSWLDHVTQLRVEYAKRLLRETKRSVTAIAFECGFEELSNFYRAFKKHAQVPPLEWRHSDR